MGSIQMDTVVEKDRVINMKVPGPSLQEGAGCKGDLLSKGEIRSD